MFISVASIVGFHFFADFVCIMFHSAWICPQTYKEIQVSIVFFNKPDPTIKKFQQNLIGI